ncbi:MAG: tetratricopeptide repeat protein [Bacteroidetes bacterium]|nr:tetratricopeptide repeat protein [Bacteroidota bacterium]MBU1719363.1 tetratricopeptide repeat protein [Bacteroidota bacterium]
MRIIIAVSLIFLQLTGFSQTTANDFFDKGEKEFNAGIFHAAIESFNKCLEIAPYFYDANVGLGKCYYKLDRKKEALDEFNKALGKKSDDIKAIFNRGIVMFDLGKYEDALKDFDLVVEKKPDYSDVYGRRAFTHLQMGNGDLALKDFGTAIGKYKDKPDLYHGRAQIYCSLGKSTEALADFSKALQLKAQFPEALLMRATLYDSLGKKTEAVADYSKLIGMNEKSADIYSRRAEAYYELKKWAEANADFAILVATYKVKDIQIHLKKAICYQNLANYTESNKEIGKALIIDKDNEDARFLRIDNNMKTNKVPTAMNDLRLIIEKGPKNIRALKKRADILYEQQNYLKAIEDLDRLIKLEPTADLYYKRAACKEFNEDRVGSCADLKMAASMGHEEAKKVAAKYCQ